jgi:hypothetical protein
LLAGVSFLVYLGNGLALEGASGGVARFGILGMVGGSVVAGAAVILAVVPSRRFTPLAIVLAGGLAGGAAGWLLGSLMFYGGRYHLEWMMALCLAPVGMWLGSLAGPREAG